MKMEFTKQSLNDTLEELGSGPMDSESDELPPTCIPISAGFTGLDALYGKLQELFRAYEGNRYSSDYSVQLSGCFVTGVLINEMLNMLGQHMSGDSGNRLATISRQLFNRLGWKIAVDVERNYPTKVTVPVTPSTRNRS